MKYFLMGTLLTFMVLYSFDAEMARIERSQAGAASNCLFETNCN